jgi:nicotinamide phosphoribosyltransferase
MEYFNPLDLADGYKLCHNELTPANTTFVSSYGCSRKGAKWPVTMVAGYFALIKKYLTIRLTVGHVEEFVIDCRSYLPPATTPFPCKEMLYIATELEGRWPISIVTVPEGTLVETDEPQWVVESTDEKATLAVQWLETFVLPAFWTGSTIATNSFFFKMVCMEALEATGCGLEGLEGLDFMVHDFGQRGTIMENAQVGGYTHALNFEGSDNLLGRRLAINTYGAPKDCVKSIPASEHSVMTARGRDGEHAVFDKMLELYGDTIFACVIDSYNMEDMLDYICSKAPEIKAKGGTVVVRPDSGEPEDSVMLCLDKLADGFGYTKNECGFIVLDSSVRVIQGDGISSPERAATLYSHIAFYKYAAVNLNLGSGGGLLQLNNRDTQRYAQKTSYVEYDGVGHDVYKDPVTATGEDTKTSRRGRQTVKDGIEVYRNGDMTIVSDFAENRARAYAEADRYFELVY